MRTIVKNRLHRVCRLWHRIHICVYICINKCIYVCVYIYIYMHIHIDIDMYIYTRTIIQNRLDRVCRFGRRVRWQHPYVGRGWVTAPEPYDVLYKEKRQVDALGVITISRRCFERRCSNQKTPPYHSNLSFVALRNRRPTLLRAPAYRTPSEASPRRR